MLSKEKEYALEIDDTMCFYDEPLPPTDEEDEKFEEEFLRRIKGAIE